MLLLWKRENTSQAVELDEVVLVAMRFDKKGIDEGIDILQQKAFYKEAHHYIFEAIDQLFVGNQPIDPLTVSTQLGRDDQLGLHDRCSS